MSWYLCARVNQSLGVWPMVKVQVGWALSVLSDATEVVAKWRVLGECIFQGTDEFFLLIAESTGDACTTGKTITPKILRSYLA